VRVSWKAASLKRLFSLNGRHQSESRIFGKRKSPVLAGVVSFPLSAIHLWLERNGLLVFLGIPLRIEAQSGAIEPTSRKGVGPGLWWSHEDASPQMVPVPEPYV
jgi:hypothetical protein